MPRVSKVKAGDDLLQKFNARAFNSFADAANSYRKQIGDTPKSKAKGIHYIYVKNTTGYALDRYNIVSVDGIVFGPADNLDEFKNNPCLIAVDPDPQKRIAIVQEPIPVGGIGRSIIDGWSVCKVQGSGATALDTYIKPTSGNRVDFDLHADGGVGQVVYRQGGTSSEWAIVKLGNTSVDSFVVKVTTEVSPKEGDEPGDGAGEIQVVDAFGELQDSGVSLVIYNLTLEAVAYGEIVLVNKEPVSGKWIVVKGGSGAAIFKGRATEHILRDQTGDVIPIGITEVCEETDPEETADPVSVCNYNNKPIWKHSLVTYYAVGSLYLAITSDSAYLMVVEADYPSNADNEFADFAVDMNSCEPYEGGVYDGEGVDEEEEEVILEIHNPYEITIENNDKVLVSYSVSFEKWVALLNMEAVEASGGGECKHGYSSGTITARSGAQWGQGLMAEYVVDDLGEETLLEVPLDVFNKSTIAITNGKSIKASPVKTTTGATIWLVDFKDCDSDTDS